MSHHFIFFTAIPFSILALPRMLRSETDVNCCRRTTSHAPSAFCAQHSTAIDRIKRGCRPFHLLSYPIRGSFPSFSATQPPRLCPMTAFIHGNVADSIVVEESGNGQFKQGMRFRRAAADSISVDRLRRMTEPCVFSRDLCIPADDSFKNAFGGVVLWPRMYPRVSAGSLLLD